MLYGLSTLCLKLSNEVGFIGGEIDSGVFHPSQNVRLPGPRIAKDGFPFMSRLVFSVD